MNKNECFKSAKMFLKLAECDLTLIRIMKTAKMIITAMLLIKSAAFALMMLCGMKKES